MITARLKKCQSLTVAYESTENVGSRYMLRLWTRDEKDVKHGHKFTKKTEIPFFCTINCLFLEIEIILWHVRGIKQIRKCITKMFLIPNLLQTNKWRIKPIQNRFSREQIYL